MGTKHACLLDLPQRQINVRLMIKIQISYQKLQLLSKIGSNCRTSEISADRRYQKYGYFKKIDHIRTSNIIHVFFCNLVSCYYSWR